MINNLWKWLSSFRMLTVTARSIELRIEDLKTDIHDIRDSQRELADKVTTLENRPAIETKARWDSLSDKLIWLFAAGIAGFLLANVLPGVF